MIKNRPQFQGLNVTFNTTEDCNLACKYCYEINKCKKSLDFEKAKRFIDFLIDDNDPLGIKGSPQEEKGLHLYKSGLVVDFIGGDSLMNVQLVDKIMQYLMYRLYTAKTENAFYWKNHWRMSISTNGTLFSRPEVRSFCEKYQRNLCLGVSIDGSKELHDLNRVFPDGRGSMDSILENWEWYKKTFPYDSQSTKATLARASIPYLYDSLVFMHEKLGLKYINQNFIMEDTECDENDYKELDKQLKKCVEYCLSHKDEIYWSMIDKTQFADHHRSEGSDWENEGRCGSGCMPALSVDGKIYPCFRWLPHTQKENSEEMLVGDTEKGFYNKEAFEKVRIGSIRANCTKDEECRTCEYESACSYCIGGCFAEFNDFVRTTHICEITKLQCKWAKVYWNEYNKSQGKPLDYPEEFLLDSI